MTRNKEKKGIFDNLKVYLLVIFFSKEKFSFLLDKLTLKLGIFSFLVNVFIFAIPSDKASFYNLPYNYMVILTFFFVILILIYFLVSLLSKEFVNIFKFFIAVNYFFMLSLVFISVPIFLITHFIIFKFLSFNEFASFFFTLIPYYNMVYLGWVVENWSGLKKLKGIIIALITIFLIYFFSNYLGNLTL